MHGCSSAHASRRAPPSSSRAPATLPPLPPCVPQAQSSVPIDEPLFQPFPPEVVFSGYEPHEVCEATLRLRNNDKVRWPAARRRTHAASLGTAGSTTRGAAGRVGSARGARSMWLQAAPESGNRLCLLPAPTQVARRVRVEACDSAYFSVRPAGRAGSVADTPAADASESSKVAPGMEVAYAVTFRPDSIEDAQAALLVATERERFAVPLVAVGAAPALDLPDAIAMREVPPVRAAAQQPVLVRNVGGAPGGFSLAASGPFTVAPARGHLAPGETLQAVVTFTPAAAGRWEGELQVVYEGSGRSTYTQLAGEGRELPVGLSAEAVDFFPAHLGRLSQKSVWVVNDSDRAVTFAFKQRPAAQLDADAAAAAMLAAASGGSSSATGDWGSGSGAAEALGGGGLASAGGNSSTSVGDDALAKDTDPGGAPQHLSTGSRPDTGASASTASGSGSSVLADATLAAARAARRAARDATTAAAVAAFESPHFAAFPPCGMVPPGGRAEVVLQFAPDHARPFEATAYVELDGREARLPLVLRGRGLGAVARFTYDSLDVGDAFVNTLHQYTLELVNRGKVDAEFSLQHSHTRWVVGSQFQGPASVRRTELRVVCLTRACAHARSDGHSRFAATMGLHHPSCPPQPGRTCCPPGLAPNSALSRSMARSRPARW